MFATTHVQNIADLIYNVLTLHVLEERFGRRRQDVDGHRLSSTHQ